MPIHRAAIAEFVATFALTFVGAAAIILSYGQEGALISIALAHGLILAAMVSATLHISGAQINPAVSFALALIGRQSLKQAASFAVAQILGSITAAGLVKVLMSGAVDPGAIGNVGATLGTLTAGDETGRPLTALGFEVIATFLLMFVIMGTAVDCRAPGTAHTVAKSATVAGFSIGFTVAAVILMIGPLTGASMNPARSIGPAVVSAAWNHHWVYWVGPAAGAAAAAVTYETVFKPPREP